MTATDLSPVPPAMTARDVPKLPFLSGETDLLSPHRLLIPLMTTWWTWIRGRTSSPVSIDR